MTSEDLPRRKKIRLEGYDYSANGLYFVTICVTEKYQVLWENVGPNSVRPLTANEILHPKLSVTGKLVKRKLTEISGHYPDVFVEMSCIMPDHVHILCELPTKLSVAAFFQHIKSESSKYLKYSSNFANWKKWGRIFGCFTVDYETRDRRIDYIKNQRIHHATRSFEDEFREMLNINGFSDETVLLGDESLDDE